MGSCRRREWLAAVAFMWLLAAPCLAQEGRIEGQVLREDGKGLPGVTVIVNELSLSDISGSSGQFSFAGVPAGKYSLSMTLGDQVKTVPEVTVQAGSVASVRETVDWKAGLAESMTVFSASRRVERVVEAPAAITSVSEVEIAQKAPVAQVAKLVEFTPGAEVTQSGVYDYNLNTRGFNSSLTRRVATLIDGRDPAVPFLGAQEWAAVSFPLDDIERLELIRGPSAALYGANASSGVLNVTTRAPRYSQGGLLRVTAGELDTVMADGRWAGSLGGSTFVKLVAGSRNTGDYSVSRRGAAEYTVPCTATRRTDCLPQEAVPLTRLNDDDVYFGSLRLDHHLDNGMVATAEGGYSDISGPIFQTGIGRVQVVDNSRPWARVNWNADRFNFLAYYNGRKAPRQTALSSGTNISLDEDSYRVEGQTNWTLAGGRIRFVAGASAGWTKIDTRDPDTDRQTLLFAPVDSDSQAAFGQVDWKIADKLKLVAAARGDWSSLHEAQFSPKASLVYSLDASNSLRVTFNRAFQVPNYSEFFLLANLAPPANLSPLNAVCARFGVNCGFGPTRVVAVGNAALQVETIKTWEAGYSGVIKNKALLTLEYYRSEAEDFITDLLPQLGTPLGRINPAFGPWRAPAGLPAPVAAAIQQQVPLLSNSFDGSNILAAASYTNFGKVDTQGVDLGLKYFVAQGAELFFNYSWFDFKLKEQLRGFDNLLLPNSPEHKIGAGIGYMKGRFGGNASVRWVDEFRWAVGPFVGPVPSYTVADVAASYNVTPRLKLGVNVSNVLNDEHWESFGGDILERRALASLAYQW